jgi:site-specific recombinase XerD
MLDDITRFVNWIRRRNPDAHTWRDYRCDLQQFEAIVGDRLPAEVTFKDVDDFVAAQVEQGFNPATINRRLAAVLSFYTFLADELPDLVCPVLTHRHFLRQRRRLPRPVAAADLERFLAAIKDVRDWAVFLLMLRCGLRIGEVVTLRLQDLYLDEQPPRLLVQGKNSKERSVYLSPQATQALRAYLVERPSMSSTSNSKSPRIGLAGNSTLSGRTACTGRSNSQAANASLNSVISSLRGLSVSLMGVV